MKSLVACVLTGLLSSSAVAGDLTPPPGPVAPTMKPLNDVEPRTAVNAENTPGNAAAVFVIDQPGSYYLTGNVQGAAALNGVLITSDNVTLDLNGFTVQGAPDALSGIGVQPEGGGFTDGVAIRNGVVRDWPQHGIIVQSDVCRIEDIAFISNGTWAVIADDSFSLHLSRCVALNNGNAATTGTSDGDFRLATESHVRDCTSRSSSGVSFFADSGSGNANLVNCSSISPRNAGFLIGNPSVSMSKCTSYAAGNGAAEPASGFELSGSAVTLDACTSDNAAVHNFLINARSVALSGCASSGAENDGFRVTGGNSVSIVNCTSQGDLDGFSLAVRSATLENCTAVLSNGQGFDLNALSGVSTSTVTLRGCVANEASGAGFDTFADNTAFFGCMADSCGTAGFSVGAGSLLEGCSAIGNGGNGFRFFNSEPSVMRGCVADNNAAANIDANSNVTIDACRIGTAESLDAVVLGFACVIKNSDLAVGCLTPAAIRVNGFNTRIVNNTIINQCTAVSGTGVLVESGDAVIDGNTFEGFTFGINLSTTSSDCHVWRNFFNDTNPIVDNGSTNVIAPILNDATIATATNPFANWDD